MAKRTVSLFFTSLHTPPFKLLKLDLKPELTAAPPTLLGAQPFGCPSDTPAFIVLAQTPKKTDTLTHKVPLCQSVLLLLLLLSFDTCLPVCGLPVSPETASQEPEPVSTTDCYSL